MITPNGESFVLVIEDLNEYECRTWRAKTPNGKKEICNGATDIPRTPEEEKAFIAEVSECVDHTLGWVEI